MAEYAYENLPVSVRKTDTYYEVGFVLHGAFFPFGRYNQGAFESDVSEAQVNEQAAQDEAQRRANLAAQPQPNAPQQ